MVEFVIKPLSEKRLKPPKTTILVICGLTPGKQQHEKIEGNPGNPSKGAFTGSIRSQIFRWFDALGLNSFFGVEDKHEIYDDKFFRKYIYLTSLLREPVYVRKNGKLVNYSGGKKLPNDPRLHDLAVDTLNIFRDIKRGVLIIPFGVTVNNYLEEHQDELSHHTILRGFPHPSGRSMTKNETFEKNKRKYRQTVSKYLNSLPEDLLAVFDR